MKNHDEKTCSGTFPGFGGDITVTLTVKDGRIIDCAIAGGSETPEIGARAVAEMPAQFVSAGNLNVDGVSGATVSVSAVRNAAALAYNKAMGAEAGVAVMKPGKYSGSAPGHWGIWELPVTITVSERALLKIELPDDPFAHGETCVVLQSVKEKLLPRMIEAQSVSVDAVAGATVSSNAVKISVENALREALAAGGSPESAIRRFYNRPIKECAGITEELETDIVIVGMSTGGIAAMKSAVETIREINGNKPVSVLAIDKAGKYGGRTALAHAMLAVNPPEYQKTVNEGRPFIDAEAFFELWLKSTTNERGEQTAKEDVIAMFIKESGKTIDWLAANGWRFGSMGKGSAVAEGYNEFNSVLTSRFDPGTYEDRRNAVDGFYKLFLADACSKGARYLLETEAYDFICEKKSGDITGIKARNKVSGKEYVIHAKAVIMGTGGFAASDELMNTLPDPRWRGTYKRLGMGMDDGLMIKAALKCGAGTWNIDMPPLIMHAGLPRHLKHFPIHFDAGTLGLRTGRSKTWTLNDIPLGMGCCADTIKVDRKGFRFCNEARMWSFAASASDDAFCRYRAGPFFYSIHSRDQVDNLAENGFRNIPVWEGYVTQGGVPEGMPLPEIYECLDACVDEGLAWKADTLKDLAARLGIDPANLTSSVETYNGYCKTGVDAEFCKDPKYLKEIGSGPYYAIKIMNTPFASAGGLDVDEQIRVLKTDRKTPMRGLYAIGCDSMGVLLNPEKNYSVFPGTAQGWNVTSGRLAGINAARFVSETCGLSEVSGLLSDLPAVF